jgi:hypothetical protein
MTVEYEQRAPELKDCALEYRERLEEGDPWSQWYYGGPTGPNEAYFGPTGMGSGYGAYGALGAYSGAGYGGAGCGNAFGGYGYGGCGGYGYAGGYGGCGSHGYAGGYGGCGGYGAAGWEDPVTSILGPVFGPLFGWGGGSGGGYGGGAYGSAYGGGCRSAHYRARYGGYTMAYLPRRYWSNGAYAAFAPRSHRRHALYASVYGMKRHVFQASASIVRHYALKHDAGLRG